MKTALQEFIDNVIPMHIIELHDIKQAIKKAIEKEKEQIMDAHTHAYLIGEDNITIESANEAGLRYYNQTYNQNK
jgi:microsomal dipeptidase-like Zn-dependent dipeptidase